MLPKEKKGKEIDSFMLDIYSILTLVQYGYKTMLMALNVVFKYHAILLLERSTCSYGTLLVAGLIFPVEVTEICAAVEVDVF